LESNAVTQSSVLSPQSSRYAAAGVDIAAGERAVELMRTAVRSTHGPRVLGDLGAFGGLFRLGSAYRDPILVSSTDGVGTKLKVAIALQRYDTIGRDLVAHCVNDILTTGAEPLFFLDYVAMGRLDPERVAEIVTGMALECRENGCALIGGETAEMPDLYAPGDFDLAGFIVGVVERDRLVDGAQIAVGDLVWGLPSSGLHTNGYSLARRVLADLSWDGEHPRLGESIGDALLRPHRSYLAAMRALVEAGLVVGMAHITGGGIVGNVPRVLPAGLAVELDWGAWPVPPIFDLTAAQGAVPFDEMIRVFNMGLGWVFMTRAADEARVAALAPAALVVGRVVSGSADRPDERVRIRNA
jgi:phosphoribosylformylglycinamidine cyclo-ligase